jgi:hypothetical protein
MYLFLLMMILYVCGTMDDPCNFIIFSFFFLYFWYHVESVQGEKSTMLSEEGK